jgi:hypothetical protein
MTNNETLNIPPAFWAYLRTDYDELGELSGSSSERSDIVPEPQPKENNGEEDDDQTEGR